MLERYKRFMHDKLGYGYKTKLREKDSFQSTYGCRFCDQSLAQDSQGNWFHLS